MKKERTQKTDIGELSVPRKKLVRVRRSADLGSNLMECWKDDGKGFDPSEFVDTKFKGYGDKRKPFTQKEVEEFIDLCAQNPKLKERYAKMLIIIFGQLE